MSRTVTIVNAAIDKYVADMRKRGMDPWSVQAKTLAHYARVPRDKMSNLLQTYRVVQSDPASGARYVIGAEGYGRGGHWKILLKPGSDPHVLQQNRRDHGRYAAEDMKKRMLRDLAYEVYAATGRVATKQQVDLVLAAHMPFLVAQVTAIVDHIERVLQQVP